MSHARHQIRAFCEDGPHAGETVPVDPDDAGGAPRRITLPRPAHHPGLGDATELGPDAPDGHSDTATYRLCGADTDVGVWRYRLVRPGQMP